jgi:hypothetical protein
MRLFIYNKFFILTWLEHRAQSTEHRAQGTIEYLVIIAIVVVIALVVVSILTGFLDQGSQVNEKQSKLYWQTQPLAIIDSQTDSQGNILVALKNNTDETKAINSITVNGVTTYPENFSLSLGETKTIYLNKPDLVADTSNQLSITYTTRLGLSKTLTGTTNLVSEQTTTINPSETVVLLNKDNCFDWSTTTPHPICNCNDLNNVDFNSTTLDWNYVLQNNLDFRNCDSSYTTGEGWIPLGSYNIKFTGIFDGQGYTISNLYINRASTYQGLFGFPDGAEISNLGLIDVNVNGGSETGGLTGKSWGTSITSCYVTGSVSGTYAVGGLAGSKYDSDPITNSYSEANVTGTGSYVGGLVGTGNSPIINSYATGNVTSSSSQVGGLVGLLTGPITNSYATGDVTGTSKVGGLVGLLDSTSAIITNSYATGSATGSSYHIGGLVGRMYSGSINNSFATGLASGTSEVGGVTGNGDGGNLTNNWWYSANTDGAGEYVDAEVVGEYEIADSVSDFYSTGSGSGAAVYTGSPVWDFTTIWNAQGSNYPDFR